MTPRKKCIMMKYGAAFYDHHIHVTLHCDKVRGGSGNDKHTALNASYIEVK